MNEKRKGVRKKFVLVVFALALVALVLLLINASRVVAGPIGPHEVNFVGAEHSAPNIYPAFTKLTYEVISGDPAILAWVLEMPECIGPSDMLEASENWQWMEDLIRGVKFTDGYAIDESRDVWVKIKEHWKVPCPASIGVWGECTTSYWASTNEGLCCEPPTAVKIANFTARNANSAGEETQYLISVLMLALFSGLAIWRKR